VCVHMWERWREKERELVCACASVSVRDALVMTVRLLRILGVCVCWERESVCVHVRVS